LSTNTIELSGKRYDAVTGKMLGTATGHRQSPSLSSRFRGHQGRSIDGIASRSKVLTRSKIRPAAPTASFHRQGKPVRSLDGFAHPSGSNLVPHQPERSTTLMRTGVKQPVLHMKPAIKKQYAAESRVPVLNPVTPKLSASKVSPNRLEHARQVAKSGQVEHFSRAQQAASARAATARSDSHEQVAATPKRQRAVVEQSEEDMFESAIAQATSHEQKAPRRHLSLRRKLGNSAAIGLALIIVGVFVAYLNLSTIEMNVASMQAGFHVTMPNYKALGFNLDGPVRADGSRVAMSFVSGNSEFTLTQEASNWDNQTLMETLAAQSDSLPKTIQASGRTIYMTHTNQATWVNGGVKYVLTGNANLNNQEITAVADSM
jgi:hypothetical protein